MTVLSHTVQIVDTGVFKLIDSFEFVLAHVRNRDMP